MTQPNYTVLLTTREENTFLRLSAPKGESLTTAQPVNMLVEIGPSDLIVHRHLCTLSTYGVLTVHNGCYRGENCNVHDATLRALAHHIV